MSTIFSKNDITIIGAGIVGLSTAYNLQKKFPSKKILVIDKENTVAAHQTGHNSGVIHSGLYYKPGSAKALNCIKGYSQIIEFAKEHNIDHDICGKIVVAISEKEEIQLEKIYERGIQNGLTGLKKLTPEQAREIEPHVFCTKAILVPQTGIINYKQVSEKFRELIIKNGGEVSLNTKLIGAKTKSSPIILETTQGDIETTRVINCSGLYSDKVSKILGIETDVQILPFRGEYYKLEHSAEHLVNHLIYPVPNPDFPFLGVHFTRMITGGIEAGPNAVLAFAREGYTNTTFNASEFFETLGFKGFRHIAAKYWREGSMEMYRSFSKHAFVKTLQKLIPEIKSSDVNPYGAGVRAQACNSKGELLDDFSIYRNENIINVVNAPSPAATASLAVGESIANLVDS